MKSLPGMSLAALTEAAAAINSTLDLSSVLTTVARLACEVTRGEVSCVFGVDDSRKKLIVLAATGQWQTSLVSREFDLRLGLVGLAVRTCKPLVISDVRTASSFCKKIDDLSSMTTRSLLAVPMIRRGEVIGVIEVVNRRDGLDFSDTDLKVLQVFAALATLACENARRHTALKEQLAGLREAVTRRDVIIGKSPNWLHVMELCERVAKSPATVLLLGETGTGKELTARYVHNVSRRRDETFVAVNCAALPEALLESELFGHEKGSFTGAHARHHGWFEVAEGGTLFLDEVGEIGRSMQAKLLRVLQEKTIMRVGGNKPIHCDVRIVAATNRNLKNMMINNVFREDLYYRLSVFPIHLPPLRERRCDIPLFVEHFVEVSRREYGIARLQVARETMDILQQGEWRGNVRELHNIVQRAVLMADGEILRPDHLPSDLVPETESKNDGWNPQTLHGQERSLIVKALEEHGWNQSKAARSLGITRYHMRHRIKKYGLEKPDPGRRSTA